MKHFKTTRTLLLPLCFALTLASCSSDNDANPSNANDISPVVACLPSFSGATSNITEQGSNQSSVYTDIVINAPMSTVWSTLTDFRNMPNWSTSFQGLSGEVSNGGSVVATLLMPNPNTGAIAPVEFPHTLSYTEGSQFGWSDPIATLPGIVDNHQYRLEALSECQTRFIQTDVLTGSQNNVTANAVAQTLEPSYNQFNAELKSQVERSIVFKNISENTDATLLYALNANITGMEGIGVNPQNVLAGQVAIPSNGLRQNFNFGGTTTGELAGTLAGTDYLTVRPNGSLFIDAYGTLTTTDDAKIAVRVRGESIPRENSTLADITEVITFSTNNEKYAYLNNKHVVGVGTSDASTGALNINAYGLDNDPFNNNAPYQEAQKPDYANFPYTAQSIENNTEATLVYELQAQITGAEGFGVDPNAVIAGQVAIPEKGLRMDLNFQGTLNGEITGNLEGIDYLTVHPNGNLQIDAMGIITTNDGQKIALNIDGLTIPSTDAQGISNVYESGTLISNATPYNRYNDKYIVGVGTSTASTLNLKLYHFDNNPFTQQ